MSKIDNSPKASAATTRKGRQQRVVRGELRYYKTVRTKRDGGETRTHLEGIGDSYTLCGLDTAGDDRIHGKPPIELPTGKHRITCELCLQTISIVREYLKASNVELSDGSSKTNKA